MTVCSNPDKGFCLRFFRELAVNSERGGSSLFPSWWSVIFFNGILADFWRQDFYSNEFDLNGFLFQLSSIFESVPAI